MKTLLALAVLFLGAFTSAFAAEKPVNTTLFGIAIKGTDPVAYFTDGKAVAGDSAFTHEWAGAKWRFASEEHRKLFAAAPEKYAPQFGGYCAWAVSRGYTAGIDPQAWKLVDGKLYLNYSRDVQKTWEENVPANIVKANENWPKLIAK